MDMERKLYPFPPSPLPPPLLLLLLLLLSKLLPSPVLPLLLPLTPLLLQLSKAAHTDNVRASFDGEDDGEDNGGGGRGGAEDAVSLLSFSRSSKGASCTATTSPLLGKKK